MAAVTHSALLRFAAAASAATLTMAQRLIRNSRYYNSTENEPVKREYLLYLCRESRRDAYGLQNLLMNHHPEMLPFAVSIAGRIDDRLEELHRKLLFFEADLITELIPAIDGQRAFWAGFTEPEFYGPPLIVKLEKDIPACLQNIEDRIGLLPVSASI